MTDPSTPDHEGEPLVTDRSKRPVRLPDDVSAVEVLDQCPAGVILVDSSGTIAYANERAAATVDSTRADLVGRTYADQSWEISYVDGTPISEENHPVGRVFETGEPVYQFDHYLTLADGTERWISSNISPVFGDDGSVTYVVIAIVDVTSLKHRDEGLTSDHVRLVEFRADRSAVPPSLRASDADETRIEVESVVSLPDETSVQYMSTADLSAGDFVATIEEVPHFFEVRLLSTTEERTRIEAHAEPGTVSEVFPSLGGRPRAITVHRDEVRFLGELPGDVDPRRAGDCIREFHTGIELVSQELVYSPHMLYDVVADALTDRQFAAIEAAYFGGYFDTPRDSTGRDLSDRFGVTRQTFNQHLRNAQQTVFRHLFEKSGADVR